MNCKASSESQAQARVGGFGGYFDNSVVFNYCENYANIVSQYSHGFAYLDPYGRKGTFINCVNSGNVTGTTEAYGFTNGVNKASKNVVNKGIVTATYAYPLWSASLNSYTSDECSSCFAVNGTCDLTSSKRCLSYEYFNFTEMDEDMAYYHIVNEEKCRTDDFLNEEAIPNAPNGFVFSRGLDIDTFKMMSFGNPINEDDWLIPGNPMNSIQNRVNWVVDDYVYLAEEENNTVYFPDSSFVDHDLKLTICFNVTVADNETSTLFAVKYDDTLDTVPSLHQFFEDEFYAYEVLSDTLVHANTNVLRKMLVRNDTLIRFIFFLNPESKTLWMFYDSPLDSLQDKVSWNMADYVYPDTNGNIHLSSSIVKTNLTLAVAYNITIIKEGSVIPSYVLIGSALETVDVLKPYFSNKAYAVIDETTMRLMKSSDVVEKHMVLRVEQAVRVRVDTKPFPPTDLDVEKIKNAVADLLGSTMNITVLFFDAALDKSGNVISIIIGVKNEEDAQKLIDAINALTPGDNCVAGVLCNKENAYIEVVSSSENTSANLSISYRLSVDVIVLIFALLCIIFV